MAKAKGTSSAPSALVTLVRARDPHPAYDGARAVEGVRFDDVSRCWIVTDHAAARALLADDGLTSDVIVNHGTRSTFAQRAVHRQIIFHDDAQQKAAQLVILRESSARMPALVPALRVAAQRLVDELRGAGGFDLVNDVALPYSMEAIARVLGVPVDDRALLDRLAQWSMTFANVTSGYLAVPFEEIDLLGAYFCELVEAKRRMPGDDLVSVLLREQTFADPEDLVINCMMAFTAGRVTTQKLLTQGIPLLMDDWATHRAAASANPGGLRRLTDELLRFVTPTRYVARRASRDVEVPGEEHGRVIKPGEKVIVFLEAANRDPSVFTEPHCVAAQRPRNPHVAFGHGAHRCPGANIARLEIQTLLEVLLETFSELRPDSSVPPTWEPNPNLGGFASYRCHGR